MKILTIAHNAVAASNRRRFEALAALPEIDATLLTPRWWHEEGRRISVTDDAPWHVGRTLFTGNGTRHVYTRGLFGAIRALQPDVIDLVEEPFTLVALQALVARELLAPHAALVFYSAVNLDRRWRQPYRAIEQLVLRRADGAHVPSAEIPPILRGKGMQHAPLEVVPLGVDVDAFAGAEPLQLDDAPPPRVGFLGRLEPVKGLDVLLDAFDRLHTPATLVIAGDGSERQRITQACATKSRARLLPAIAFERVGSFLRAIDVLVLPSITIPPLHREQFGRVLVEAMAAGVPVIGSDSGGIPETIGDAGLVVPERDAAALAVAINRVLQDAALRRTLIQRGQQRVRARYAWSVVAGQTERLFRSAIVHRRRAPTRLEEQRV